MAATTLYTILLNLQNRIVNMAYPPLGGSQKAFGRSTEVTYGLQNVHIVTEFKFPETPNWNEFIQIGILSCQQPSAKSGVPLVRGKIRVGCYRKALQDFTPDSTDRIAQSYGVLPILTDLEKYLPQTYLQGVLVEPLMIDVMSSISGSPQEIVSGWVYGYRDFTFGADLAIPSIAYALDGIAYDRGG